MMTPDRAWSETVRAGQRSLWIRAVLCTVGVATALSALLGVEQQRERDQELQRTEQRDDRYVISFASFAPLDTDIFIADADGGNACPLVSTQSFEANASFSADDQWVVFSSN